MSRVGLFECLVLVAFFLSGLAAFLVGGMVWLGHVAQAFMWTSFVWLARALFLECKDELLEEIERSKAFQEWRKRQKTRLRGME